MAFVLTSDIIIDDANIKANKVTWKTNVNSFIDTCTIDLPRKTYLINEATNNTVDMTEEKKNNKKKYRFKTGDKVSVSLGYDKKNEKRFEGFVKRVNMGIPVQLECEGYGYQLYDIIFNKTYSSVTVKQLLKDLIAGTDIVLSSEIPDIPLKNVRFKNASGIQVLEWLKKECLLAVYFNFNEIFVGTMFGKQQERVKVKIGWNTVKDDDFKQKEIDKKTNIVIREKDQQGEVNKTKARHSKLDKYSTDKTVKIKAGIPANFMKEIAERLQNKEDYKGYEGNIVLFLQPLAKKGMVMELDGGEYPEKTGEYFIESVSGEFGENGGRQTVQLGFLMQK